MPTDDAELVSKLLESTEAGRIDWQPTATTEQFAAAFGGKWTVTVDKSRAESGEDFFWLSIASADGNELLRIYNYQEHRLENLFENARRRALHVDEAIKDIFKELDRR